MRSREFSKAMLRGMACDGVKSESVDDSDIEYVWDTRCRSSDQHQPELHVCSCVCVVSGDFSLDVKYVWDAGCNKSDQHQLELHECVCGE